MPDGQSLMVQLVSVQEASELADVFYQLLKTHSRNRALLNRPFHMQHTSPDHYESPFAYFPRPPNAFHLVKAGPRIGWQWCGDCYECDIAWFDEEPLPSDPDYLKYHQDLRVLESKREKFHGFYLENLKRLDEELEGTNDGLYFRNIRNRLEEHGPFFGSFSMPPTREEYHELCKSLGGQKDRIFDQCDGLPEWWSPYGFS